MPIQFYTIKHYVFIQIWVRGDMKRSKPISVKADENWVEKLKKNITAETKIMGLAGNCPQFTEKVETVIELIQEMHTANKEV